MFQSAVRRRSGFTLVELLVVISIIAVLLALLVPAIQKAREAANRASCQNNLKNIGIALMNYQHSNRAFPPGAKTTTMPTGTVSHSWGTLLLPFIDQESLEKQYNYAVNWSANTATIAFPVRAYHCASSPSPRVNPATSIATTDYAAVAGVAPEAWAAGVALPPGNPPRPAGIMSVDVAVRLSELIDGASNTIAIVEIGGRPQLMRGIGPIPGPSPPGAGWADPANMMTVQGDDGVSPPPSIGNCAINCTNFDEIYSFHPGGAHVVFADGSVRQLSPGVNTRVVAALATFAGKEPIPGGF
jgi:prepilin-type N-terminal cleavage/methylation domain-containing protein/prepilin-type processing-associated H-X9-DG protein